jgi:uncharacterized membrane protein YkvA (DUF1232 family)
MSASEIWTRRAQALQVELCAVYYATKEPRVPLFAKVVAAGAIGYQFSPIQLIPDWIPVLGFADNFCVLTIAAALVHRVTPDSVIGECRERAAAAVMQRAQARHGVAATIMMATALIAWFLFTVAVSIVVARLL